MFVLFTYISYLSIYIINNKFIIHKNMIELEGEIYYFIETLAATI